MFRKLCPVAAIAVIHPDQRCGALLDSYLGEGRGTLTCSYPSRSMASNAGRSFGRPDDRDERVMQGLGAQLRIETSAFRHASVLKDSALNAGILSQIPCSRLEPVPAMCKGSRAAGEQPCQSRGPCSLARVYRSKRSSSSAAAFGKSGELFTAGSRYSDAVWSHRRLSILFD
jgi:hypothetical protein